MGSLVAGIAASHPFDPVQSRAYRSERRRWRPLATALALVPLLLIGSASGLRAQTVRYLGWVSTPTGVRTYDSAGPTVTDQAGVNLGGKAVAVSPDQTLHGGKVVPAYLDLILRQPFGVS